MEILAFSDREWTRNGLTATVSREEWAEFFAGWAHAPSYDVWTDPYSSTKVVRVTASRRMIPDLDYKHQTKERNLAWLGTAWGQLVKDACQRVVIKRGLLGNALVHKAEVLVLHLDCVEICRTGIVPDLKPAIDAVERQIARDKWLASGDDCGDFLSHTD